MADRLMAFEQDSRGVMADLRRQVGFKFWMVTCLEQDDFVVLSTVGDDFDIHDGDVFSWQDSFCARMVSGEGPRFAPNSDEIEVYRQAPIRQHFHIKAFLGVPMKRSDGSLIGTLCAIDPEPIADSATCDLAIVETNASTLARLLESEIAQLDQLRRDEYHVLSQQPCATPGVLNELAWQSWLESEQVRAKSHGLSLGICSIKVAPKQLAKAAACINDLVDFPDVLAAIGVGELGLLLVNCNQTQLGFSTRAIELFLKQAKIDCTVGAAHHNLRQTLADSFEVARQNHASMFQSEGAA